MKRILLFTESLGSGGAERQLTGLAVLLKERGYDVRVVTYHENQFYEPYLQHNDVDYRLERSLRNRYLRPLRLARYIRRTRPDVVISFLTPCNVAASLARLFCRTRLIVSERNTNQSLGIYDRVVFTLYRLADIVVPNSTSQTRFIEWNFPALRSRLHTVTNFVDTDLFRPAADVDRPSGPLRVTVVARVTPQKNCLTFMDAVKSVKARAGVPFRIEWFGESQGDEYTRAVERKIADNGIIDVITLHPASSDIVSEYQASDIFCLPSLFEGYPNTLCEAMACGLPVLCSRVCDNPQIVADGQNGLMFNPKDVEDMARTLLAMLSMDAGQRAEMGLRSRERALSLFSKETFVDKYQNLIMTL